MSGDLHDIDWVPVPNAPYVMKYMFYNTGYNLLVSNLISVYNEKLEDEAIQRRFCELNSYAQMKSAVILENLKKSLEETLSEKSSFDLCINQDKLIITLHFHVACILCNYKIEMSIMPPSEVMSYIITPTVFGALLSQKKILQLQKNIPSIESTRSTVSPNVDEASNKLIEPDFLKGKNVPTEIVLESFLKIQNYFKELYSEHCDMYNSLKKLKTENSSVRHCVSSPQKCRHEESSTKASTSVTFKDDDDCSILLKEKMRNSEEPTEKNHHIPLKKKKVFKI